MRSKNLFFKILFSIIESLVINYIIYYFFFLKQSDQSIYLNLNPHPILFLCLIIGLRYGKLGGLFSAFISCSFFIYVFLSLNGELRFFLENINNYLYPLLFLWSAFVLGAFKDNHDRKIEQYNDEIEIIKEENKKLEKDFDIIEKVQKELKKQIVSSNESILSLYDIATKLETYQIEEIYTETIGILKKYLRVTRAKIYVLDKKNQYLRLKIIYDDSMKDYKSININNCSWYKIAYEKKAVFKYYDETEEDSPLMVGPLIKDNEIIAFVNIFSMDFDMVSEYAFQLFQLIIDWVNKAIDKASFIEQLSSCYYSENSHLIDCSFFKERLKSEERRKEEFGMEYCLLKYQNSNYSIEEIDNIIGKTLRSVDLSCYDSISKIISILIPATKKSNRYIINSRMLNNFNHKILRIE